MGRRLSATPLGVLNIFMELKMKRIFLFVFFFISASVFAQPNYTLDSIVVVTSNDTVYVWDYNAWEQCGFQFDYNYEVIDSVITIMQVDTADDATTCYGYHNFVMPLVGLNEGNYRVDIFRDCLYEDIKFITSYWFEYTFSGIEVINNLPNNFSLSNAYPNPFNPSTSIVYSIPNYGFVSLVIYNSLGQTIETLIAENQSPGKYIIDFNAKGLSSGIYYYKLQFDKMIETRKIVLIK